MSSRPSPQTPGTVLRRNAVRRCNSTSGRAPPPRRSVPTERVLVVTIGPPERPTAIAPLTRSVSGPPRRRLLGAEELGESVEVVYQDAAALELLAASLVQTGLPLSFGHYLVDTPFIETLRRAYGRRGLVISRSLPMRGSPYIKLDASWSEPEQNFTAGDGLTCGGCNVTLRSWVP